ncbi:MAG: hypothetical protein A2286_00340 [Gammaproteobacteria bacterium RIFOXYA12_FULL_61_12]|nr:MAG: hypothetical protein A2514_11320 [Gammaproteobacteria bacterium RIFOXYD12_FULL_61_37]OGT94040.1 MAG: hypothetical protein A2286_00340 [Gammaproteobacteria bacterium RIFOXYA12_FULL_61_12]
MYGVIDFSKVDTTPGARSAFAPPEGFEGSYRTFMRKRWKTDRGVRQHVGMVAGYLKKKFPTEFLGPYAKEAREIAVALNQDDEKDAKGKRR